MDVSCERCKAEYEFDDSLLGEHGTTVKCSSCNHVFRVLPQARHPSRPSLKVRTVATGRVEPLSSLRDLQRRIHAGEVGVDDELGREGFPWRKLGDVPELRSFFAKPSVPNEPRMPVGSASPAALPKLSASRGAGALSVSQSSMPVPPRDPSPNGKRTMIGVGPQNPQIPGPPRVPNLTGPGPGTRPAAPTSDRASSATASQRFAGGTPSNAGSDSDAPTDPPPPGGASSRPRSIAPPAAPSNPVAKLYLAEDEAPPARATESSSRIWLIAGVAGVILLGGVIVVGAVRNKAATPEVAPAPRVEAVPPKPEELAPPAAPEAPTSPGEATAPAAKAEMPTAQAIPEPPAEPAPTAAPSVDAKGAEKIGRDKPSGASAKEDPKDYGGFVAQGDAALARGDAAAAQKAYEGAIAMRASGSEAVTGLGYALLSSGKGREALPYFERAARNGYAEGNIGQGDAHKKLGDIEAARRAYKAYLTRLPGGARAAYVQKQLDSLKGSAAEPAEEAPALKPAGEEEYRPAGELVEPPPPPAAEPEGEAVP